MSVINDVNDIIGKRFGKLVVKRYECTYTSGKNGTQIKIHNYICDCDCGAETIVNRRQLSGKQYTKSCGCNKICQLISNLNDVVDCKFGLLTVKSYTLTVGYKHYYLCICECGKEAVILREKLKQTKSCGCLNHVLGSKNKTWTGFGSLSGKFWAQIKRNAKSRGIQVAINIEYAWNQFEKQNRKCALTGWELNMNREKRTASLDRIDSSKGYVEGNVQWVHKDINFMKQTFSDFRFRELCKAVTAYL